MDRLRLQGQLLLHEGWKPVVYDDATGLPIVKGTVVKGNPTIGIGRNLTLAISTAAGMFLLNEDIDRADSEARLNFEWFMALNPVRQNVVVELVFNLGAQGLKGFKDFCGAMAIGDYSRAASELKDSNWSHQVDKKLGDGKGRADTLIRQMATGEW